MTIRNRKSGACKKKNNIKTLIKEAQGAQKNGAIVIVLSEQTVVTTQQAKVQHKGGCRQPRRCPSCYS